MSKNQSDTVADLAAALAKAQGAIRHASTDATNPHFKSRYATLASVWDACRAALAQNNLALVHSTDRDAGGQLVLETKLIHASGEWVAGYYPIVPMQATPQGFGSALTYARRYTLAAMVGIAPDDDDDGNAAMGDGYFADKQHAKPKGKAAPAEKRAAPKQQAPATAQGDTDAGQAIADIRNRIASATTHAMFDDVTARIKASAPAVSVSVREAWKSKRSELEHRLGKPAGGGQTKTERLLQSEQEDDT